MENKKCEICGKGFKPYSKNHRFCSEDCKKINKKDYHKKYFKKNYVKKEFKSMKCVDCGKKIRAKYNHKEYCNKCMKKRINKMSLERYHKNHISIAFKPMNCITCGKEITSRNNYKKYCYNCKKKLLIGRRKKYDLDYRIKNKGNIKENGKKYLKTEKGKDNILRYNSKRRAIKSNIIEVFTEEEWKKKLELTNGICPSCRLFIGTKKLERDHIYPKIRANRDFQETGIKRIYTIKDVQPLCKVCNSIKKDKLEEVMER